MTAFVLPPRPPLRPPQVLAYLTKNRGALSDQDTLRVWRCCRFVHLTWQAQTRVLNESTAPVALASVFFEDAVASSVLHRAPADQFEVYTAGREEQVRLRLAKRASYVEA
eukprot:SAG11_NODE_54_length_19571_cov_29.437786_25_plen_110_part_00